jgi:hypothetical protein
MFGFWLPVGLLIASIGLPAILIAKKRNRITAETYRLIGVIWLVAVVIVILSIGVGWSSYQMEQTLTRFESVKARADVLQKQIKAAEAQQQLMHFADPLQEPDVVELQNYREDIRNKALSISNESKALTQELASARSQFDELNQARIHREFILFLCVLVFASTLILGAVYRDAIRGRRVEKRTALLRA